jgi:hypothetical protein
LKPCKVKIKKIATLRYGDRTKQPCLPVQTKFYGRWGNVVAQLVEAPRYKSGGHGFD